METIITLLIVLLPIAFKLIGKAIENGSAGPAAPMREQAPEMTDSAPERSVYQRVIRRQETVPVEREEGESVIERPVATQHTVQAVTEDKPKRKKKIDPKKLIVYSEIMKPKY